MKTTIKDVAREANVSVATVSRVLNNTHVVSEKVKIRVLQAIDKLNYQPNGIARSLKIHKTNTIGVIVPDITNPYFMQISKGLENVVYNEGYHLIFGSGDESPEKEAKILKLLYEKRVDAFVLATSGGNDQLINKIHQSGTPIILVDRSLEEIQQLDVIMEDNIGGAYQLTKKLLDSGHTKIGLVNGDLNVSTGMERYQGFQKAFDEYQLSYEQHFKYSGDFSIEGGKKAGKYFMELDEPPTAILCFNNLMAFGVLLEITRRGIKIPEEIVIASYGEIEAAALLPHTSLLSLKQFPYKMGVRAGEILIDRLVEGKIGPYHEVLTTELV